MQIPRSVGTHDGSFHADEVTACALLIMFDLVDENKIVRTRDPQKLAQCEYVCDVGGRYSTEHKRFDHHQVSYTGSWSSAGMVLDYLHGLGFLSHDEYEYLNNTLVHGVDEQDNGRFFLKKASVLSLILSKSTILWKKEEIQTKNFSLLYGLQSIY